MIRSISSKLKYGKWTEEEDQALRSAIDNFGDKRWKLVSEKVYGRSPIQCLHRWTKILKPGLIKGPWTTSEDQKLIDWVAIEGPNKWSKCSKVIPGRNGKQCRERWCNHLDPNVRKGQWTIEEDVIIFNFFQNYGPKWAFISKFLPGRTENSIKNRFYSTLRKIDNQKKVTEVIDRNAHEEFAAFSNTLSTQKSFSDEIFKFYGLENGSQPSNNFNFYFGIS